MAQYGSIFDNATGMSNQGVTSQFDNYTGLKWCQGPGPTNQTENQIDSADQQFYKTTQFVTGLILYPSICFPGLIGNTLTIFVLSRRNMRSSTNTFLSALAVSDSLKLLNDVFYFLVVLFSYIDQNGLGNKSYSYLYPYSHFIMNISVCVSSWLTVSVAVERYILVCHPTRARDLISRKCAVRVCLFIYVVMTILAIPFAFRYRTITCIDINIGIKLDVEVSEMWFNDGGKLPNIFVDVYTWAQTIVRSIIPLVLLFVLNTRIILALRKTRASKRRNARHRVTVMMIVVIVAFLICMTPDAILSTIFGEGYHEAGYLIKGVREITDTLLVLNAAINFLIYCAFNKIFRKSFSRMCCPRYNVSGGGWTTELDESTYRRLSEARAGNSPRKRSTVTTISGKSSKHDCKQINGHSKRKLIGGSLSMLSSKGNKKEHQELRACKSCQEKRVSGNDNSEDFESTFDENQIDQSNRRSHRSSSIGLKKSKNSLKSNRAKSRNSTSSSREDTRIEYIPACEDVNINRESLNQDTKTFPKASDIDVSSDKESNEDCLSSNSQHDNIFKNEENVTMDNIDHLCGNSKYLSNADLSSDDTMLSDMINCDGSSLQNVKQNDMSFSSNNNQVSFKPCLKGHDSEQSEKKVSNKTSVSFSTEESDTESTFTDNIAIRNDADDISDAHKEILPDQDTESSTQSTQHTSGDDILTTDL